MASRLSEQELEQMGALVREIQGEGSTWRFDGSEITLWDNKIRNIIRRVYPPEEQAQVVAELDKATNYRRTIPVRRHGQPDRSAEIFQQEFRANLPRLAAYAQALHSALGVRALSNSDPGSVELIPFLRIFTVHDGPTGARSKLEDFIRALGAEPVTAENEPSKGRQVSEKVDSVLSTCHYAVALATKARGSRQDGRTLARANVANELPRVRKILGGRWMVVLQHGVELPSNEAGFVYERFSPQSMDQVFSALVRELRGHGILSLRTPNS